MKCGLCYRDNTTDTDYAVRIRFDNGMREKITHFCTDCVGRYRELLEVYRKSMEK